MRKLSILVIGGVLFWVLLVPVGPVVGRPPLCGDGTVQWNRGETCDPPGSECGVDGTWFCGWLCQCLPRPSVCGDAIITWSAGEECEPFPGLDSCGAGEVCDPDTCRCVNEFDVEPCDPRPLDCFEESEPCTNFPPFDCICYEIAEGGGLCINDFYCDAAVDCPNGTGDCPAGHVCAVNNCCDGPKCAPARCTGEIEFLPDGGE